MNAKLWGDHSKEWVDDWVCDCFHKIKYEEFRVIQKHGRAFSWPNKSPSFLIELAQRDMPNLST